MRQGFILRLVLATAAVFGLGACRVDAGVELTVKPDGTGDIEVTVTADHEVVAAAPDLATDLRVDDLTASGWTVDGPTPTDDGGLRVVLTHPFANIAEANAILTQLSGPNGPLRDVAVDVTDKSGDVEWTLAGTLDFSSGLDALADPQLAELMGSDDWLAMLASQDASPADLAGVRFRASLPGTRINADGTTLPPGSAEFTANAGDAPVDMSVRTLATSSDVRDAKDLEERMIRYLIIYGIAVAVLVAVWLLVVGARRGRASP